MLDGQAVQDLETGLVWEQAPDDSLLRNWSWALQYCYTKRVGGRYGWRAPTVAEMASLTEGVNYTLPIGHPFDTGTGGPYWWTSTSAHDVYSYAYRVKIGEPWGSAPKSVSNHVWCVRGRSGHDGTEF